MREHRNVFVCTFILLLAAGSAFADGGVTFSDIAAGGANGLHYSRVPSARYQTFLADIANGFMDVPTEYRPAPMKPYGAPGVALFDYDGDGDLDIFVTNGPGRGNSLFKNLLKETGHLQFVDVASQAGVALTGFDSQGVCFGDIDNDGNEDLLVLGYEGNHLFHNLGNGKFKDITASSGIGGSTNTSVSCSMGDINGDGLIDIVIANTFDFAHMNAITGEPLIHDQHNQVLINRGHNVFQDVSDSSGIKDIEGIPTPGAALITWAIALVDLDQDGNLDVVLSNDQRTYNFVPPNVGFNRFFRNDGTGHFTDVTAEVHLDRPGSWRGLAFGDLNCDGKLDLFATNIGDYVFFAGTNPVGKWSSAWFFGQADGTFQLGPPGSLVTVPIGWGAAIADYDNDGDQDIIYSGNMDNTLFWEKSDPGIILQNHNCSGTFTWDSAATAGSTNHINQNIEGLAVGDLNNDGFVDIVSVSSFDAQPGTPFVPDFAGPLGSVFDPTAFFVPVFVPTSDPNSFQFTNIFANQGTLSVEINSGHNGNKWAAIKLLGTKDIVDNHFGTGTVNRDGIGAIVKFTPGGGQSTLTPVVGGASYASQNSLTVNVGLGTANMGTAEVMWPGGVRNRLYMVRSSETVLFPEIPCSFDAQWASRNAYRKCVRMALNDIRRFGAIEHDDLERFEASALLAYDQTH